MIGLTLTRKLRSGRRLMLSAAAAAALAASLGLFAPTAANAAVATPRALPPCSGSPVGSATLHNDNTGKPGGGQITLMYGCSDNWAVVSSNLGGITQTYAKVIRSDGAYAYAYCGAVSQCASPKLYSPVLKDEAYGIVWAGGVEYSGVWAQQGF